MFKAPGSPLKSEALLNKAVYAMYEVPPEAPGRPRKARLEADTLLSNITYTSCGGRATEGPPKIAVFPQTSQIVRDTSVTAHQFGTWGHSGG
jgi:hypothetical protein